MADCNVKETHHNSCCKKIKPPKCGSQEKCANCNCTKIDARLCLPCKHKFCHTCIEKMLPPDSPSLTSCPVCDCDVERLKFPNSITSSPADPCGDKGQCYTTTPAPLDEWFCYNCYVETGTKVRAKVFCLDCDVSMCEKHLQQHNVLIRKKKHRIMPICQYKLMKRKFECRRCKIHPKYTLLFVCKKCDMILCQVCVACIECEKGGRHVAEELDIVALEMATTINQGMKDVDCVRLSGEKIIAEAYKAYQQKECELEKVKQAVCREFEIKNTELCRMKEKLLCDITELIKKNKRGTNLHKNKIQEIMVEAKNAATKANQLLCYNHNVDIAKQAKGMLSELDTIKCIEFPCLDLQGYKLGHREVPMQMPCLVQDEETKTNFCPQPTIPEPKTEEACDRCAKPKSQCSPSTSCNPVIEPLPDASERCNRPYDKVFNSEILQGDPCKLGDLSLENGSCFQSAEDSLDSIFQKNPCDDIPPTIDLKKCYPENDYSCDTIKFTVTDVDMLYKVVFSQRICLNDLLWNIMLNIEKNPNNPCDKQDYFGFFIQCQNTELDPYWSCDAEIDCKLINQADPSSTQCKKFCHSYSCDKHTYGVISYMKLCDVLDPTNGFIKKGTLVVEAKIRAQPKESNCSNL